MSLSVFPCVCVACFGLSRVRSKEYTPFTLAAQHGAGMNGSLIVLLTATLLLCATPAEALPGPGVPGEMSTAAPQDLERLQPRLQTDPQKTSLVVLLPEIALNRVDQIRKNNSRANVKPLQIGVDRILADDAPDKENLQFNWVRLQDGGNVARFAITSPNAAALRLGTKLSLPEGAELRFFEEGRKQSVVDPVTAAEINRITPKDQLYWTPVTTGSTQLIEIHIPSNVDASRATFRLEKVAHIAVWPSGAPDSRKIGESQFCEADTNCLPNPPLSYTNAKNAVARMVYQTTAGTFVCTGTLLNDSVAGSSIPYLYSAHHCIDSQAIANTLITFWFYESTSCQSGILSPNAVQVAGGATHLFSSSSSDALLLRLNNPPPAGVWYSGWNAAPFSDFANVLVIHHPAGDVKKTSGGQSFGFGSFNGQGSYISVSYLAGTVEGGSSGAGLLVNAGNELILRGGLLGGACNCTNSGNVNTPGNISSYSRLDLAYSGIQPFLLPTQTQAFGLTVAKTGSGTGTVSSSPAGISCGASCTANFNAGSLVTLTSTSGSNSTFAGWSGCDTVNGSMCNVTMISARNVTAAFNASGGATTLANGVPVANLSGSLNSVRGYSIQIPAGIQNLTIQTSGGSGDPDLYVKFGAEPTPSIYDCRSWEVGPTETCTFPSPIAGTYFILIHGYAAYDGLTLTASWQSSSGNGGTDEPSFTGFQLPLPANPAFPNCPGGYFVAVVSDGPGSGLSSGIFGLDLTLNAPGTQRLEGGLNFGGSLDGSQVAFAGFNIQNSANEQQRLDLTVTGNPRGSQSGTMQARIKVIRQPSAGVNEPVFETVATLSLAQPYIQALVLNTGFHVVTIAPEGAFSVPGGAADGQVYVSLGSQFVGRPGGGFFGGVVVGGYHATPPFGDSSGFASFCLGNGHSASARVYSAPSYGATGARDLRLRLLDHASREVIRLP